MNERSSGEPPMCAWVEMSPGVRTASRASMSSTSGPAGAAWRGPTETMRSPSTTTVPSRSRRWPRPSKAITWPAWMAMRRGMGGPPQATRALPGERSYRGSTCLDRPGGGMAYFRHHADPGASTQAKAVGTPGLRLAVDGADRLCDRLPAGVFLLSVVPELRPLGRSGIRVRRREELHRGDPEGRALHGLDLEHGGDHRAIAAAGAPVGPRDRAPPEPGAPRPACHHRAAGHPVNGLAGHGGDGVADDVRRKVWGDQQPRAPARDYRRLLRLVLIAPGVDHGRRAGRGLA